MSPYVTGKEKKTKKQKHLSSSSLQIVDSVVPIISMYFVKFSNRQKVTMLTVSLSVKAREFVVRTGHTLVSDYSDMFRDDPTPAQVKAIATAIRAPISRGDYAEVKVVYSFYISAIAQKQSLVRSPVSTENSQHFSKKSQALSSLRWPILVNTKSNHQNNTSLTVSSHLSSDLMFHEMLLEAKALNMLHVWSPWKCSWIITDQSKKNSLVYNKARQAGITKEISEIVSGVEYEGCLVWKIYKQ